MPSVVECDDETEEPRGSGASDRTAGEEQPDLTSWKEIADHLEVTVRTAQEWEKKRGLPVRRIPGGGRARVFLRVEDLEQLLDDT